MKTIDCLPCSPHELAAIMGISARIANARLWGMKQNGYAKPTKEKVLNGNTGRGPKYSRLWVLTK